MAKVEKECLTAVLVVTYCVVILAAPAQQQQAKIQLIETDSYSNKAGDGSYNFAYAQDNGQYVKESGGLKEVTVDHHLQKVVISSGVYAFRVSPTHIYLVEWNADEKGYHPNGRIQELEVGKIYTPPVKVEDIIRTVQLNPVVLKSLI